MNSVFDIFLYRVFVEDNAKSNERVFKVEMGGRPLVDLSIGDVLVVEEGLSKLEIISIVAYGSQIDTISAMTGCTLTLRSLDRERIHLKVSKVEHK